MRDAAENLSRCSAGTTWMDAAAVSHTPPGRPVQGLWVFRGSCLLRFFSWEPEAWKPILICHCISEVKRPLWKRSGGDAHLQLREAAGVNPRAKERTAAEEKERAAEKGRGRAHGAQDVSTKRQLPPRSRAPQCHPRRRGAARAPKGLSRRDSESPQPRSPPDR